MNEAEAKLLEKYITYQFVKNIKKYELHNSVTDVKKLQFPLASRNGGGVLLEDKFSCSQHIVEDEAVPIQAVQIEEEHISVLLRHALLQCLCVGVLPGPL